MGEAAENSEPKADNLKYLDNERAARRVAPVLSEEDLNATFWERVNKEGGLIGKIRDKFTRRRPEEKEKPGLKIVE